MNLIAWIIFAGAALLEVGGDAVIRRGLRGGKPGFVIAGFVTLGCYGLLVNSIKWNFSKAFGAYVGFFALASVLTGWMVFREHVSPSTWVGLALVMAGCLIIQFGQR